MTQDIEKLKTVILFISDYCKDKPKFGATHLNKILYFSDFIHYKHFGSSISGADYFKLDNGPAPKQLVPAREQLIAEGRLEIKENATPGGYKQKRPTPIGEVDRGFLTDVQAQWIGEIADQACNLTATVVSAISHKHLAWELAGLKDEIPYFTIHCTKINPITSSSKTWALELAKRAGFAA